MDGGGGQADGDGVTTQGGALALADDALVLVVLVVLVVLDILDILVVLVIDVNIVSGDDNDGDK